MTLRTSLFAVSLSLGAALGSVTSACSSDASNGPATTSSNGGAQGQAGDAHAGSSSAGFSSATGGDGGSNAAAGASEAGSDNGDGNDSGAPNGMGGDPGTGEPPIPPSTCSQSAVWANASDVGVVTSSAKETLLSVTPDELDLAFLRAGSLYVAHRAQSSAAFTLGSAVVIPMGWSATQGVALSADGKRLLLVSDPGAKKLGEMRRSTRDAAFSGTVDESAFAVVNQDAVYTGKLYAYPVVSFSDTQLFFNSAFTMGASTVVVSTRSAGGNWSAPVILSTQVLDGTDTKRRLPSGVSADERTLFYFNEESMQEEARFREMPALISPLYDMVSLGTRRGATPNSACNRLYSDPSGDVIVETD